MNTDLMFTAFLTDFKEKSVRNIDFLLYYLLCEMATNRNMMVESFIKSIYLHVIDSENESTQCDLAHRIVLESAIQKSDIFKKLFIEFYTFYSL